jgi:hypothetical protein
MSGVTPLLSAPSTRAPAFSSAAIAARWPSCAARCSGVQASVPSNAFESAPAAICRSISATLPRPAASHSFSFALDIAPLHARHTTPARCRWRDRMRTTVDRRAVACGTVRRVVGERAARSVVPSHPRTRGHTGGGAARKRAPARQARRVADRRGRRGRGGRPATRVAGATVPRAIGAARSSHRPLPDPRSPRPTRRPGVALTCWL